MTWALDGLVVVDLSEGVAGGYSTRLLAGLGAEVIKVERPGAGERARPAAAQLPSLLYRMGSGINF